MKTNIYKIHNVKYCHLLFMALFMAVSCSDDYLELEPQTNLNEKSFFKTPTQIEQAVNGAYVPLRNLTNLEYWVFAEMRSDNTTFQFYQADRGLENRGLVDYFLTDASHDLSMGGLWNGSYDGIARCNAVLENIDKIEGLTASKKNQFIGEVKFLRAFYYYNLVLQFGGVPLELSTTQDPGEANSDGRASKDAIYESVIADLMDAENLLPKTYGDIDRGRATSGAAKTLLAKVYMIQKKYTEALTVLKGITGYSLVTGSDESYKDVFNPNNKGNTEIIFAVQYLGSEEGQGSNFMYQFAPNNSGNIVTGDPQMLNLNSGSGWNTPTQDMIRAYEEGDLRKDISMQEGFVDNDGNFVNQPYVSKYNFGFDLSGSTSVNFPTFRYADVLLMMAECLNEQAYVANGEAFDLVNQIRERAGLEDLTVVDAGNQEAFRNAVFHERRIELAFENHRWYDLIRSGNAVEVMNAHGEEEQTLRADIIPAGAYNVSENKLLLPIPQRAVTLDGLEQNPQ
ncbi:RagB/SusD family nutrient uptake outer membrane protein [Galbibacter pacificus]|uniref:RagB/SusD family nutrient uptake outer membrane protein n=1 Tax=Galbibacter pacificus TaxID=2996052 RepID=A0ABT6FN42_9FLAO|nr:RagB/SusD family nutrient uptake outer membrane protein [Galbibacter pacificus]MDG3581209.1 RagB/SusD family nutrient uptake outer membrane protein [Galbibacter pacificus]MDG3584687.1 RagB/SusD family nutrient uptake outer membrane protein [Galbibacter pacificus]